MNRTKWFWLIVAAQLVFLTAWAGYHEWLRQTAPTILLQCRPVDPQDLVRGDYMILRYDIGDAEIPNAESGNDAWVLLEARGRYFVVAQASATKLEPKPGQFLVRGKVASSWRRNHAAQEIEYGIESYFVPEGRGSPHFKTLEVEAAVSAAHRLYIKRVLVDGVAYP